MNKNNYVILAAMEKEIKNIKVNVPIIQTGIGMANTIKTLFDQKDFLKDKYIINVGYAGSTQYEVGTVVSVNKVLKYERSNVVEYPEYNIDPYSFVENACYTAENFIETDGYIPLVDMELYYIRMLYKNVVSFKIVSDNLNMNNYLNTPLDVAWTEVNSLLKEFINV